MAEEFNEQPKKDLSFEPTLDRLVEWPGNEDENAMYEQIRASGKEAPFPSKEESMRQEEKYIQSLITPELLKHFSLEETRKLIESFVQIPTQETQAEGSHYDLRRIEQMNLELLASEIEGKRVIEIGDAGRKLNKRWFQKLGASSFETVDVHRDSDALSFLMRQPDDSAIICSFGVFDNGSLYYSNSPELQKYIKLLCGEIYRVTPQNSISLHGLEYRQDLLDAGFTLEAEITPVVSYGNVVIFRKP